MEVEKLDRLIDAAVAQLQADEQDWLERFYAQPANQIRDTETVELPSRSIAFTMRAQEKIIGVLQAVGLPYVNTVWRSIREKLPSFDYVYINWDSVDSWSEPARADNSQYRVNVSRDDYKRAQKAYEGEDDNSSFDVPNGAWIPPAVGAAAAGTVILIGLILPGHAVLLVPALVAGAAAGLGAQLIRPAAKEPRSKSTAYINNAGKNSGNASRGKAVDIAVSAARDQNMERAADWSKRLREIALQVCQEKKP